MVNHVSYHACTCIGGGKIYTSNVQISPKYKVLFLQIGPILSAILAQCDATVAHLGVKGEGSMSRFTEIKKKLH